MKRMVVIVFFTFLIFNCVTKNDLIQEIYQDIEKYYSIEQAISYSAENISNNLSENTAVAIINIDSPISALSYYVMEELSHLLIQNKKLIVLDRSSILNIVRDELDFQMSGEVSDESAKSIGKFIGAHSIITGTIYQETNNTYRLRIICINCTAHAELALFKASI